MSNGPRTWKYAVPAFLAFVFYIYATVLEENFAKTGKEMWQFWAVIGYGAAGVCVLMSLVSLGKYVLDFVRDFITSVWTARARTTDVMLMEAIKGTHPETVAYVYGERRRSWMLRAGIELPDDLAPYSVLYAAPDVTDLFVWHFLRNSTTHRVMTKRQLADKSYKYDPMHKVTDYEQYDRFIALLQNRGIITRHSSNSAPLWVPPWTPEMLAEDYGWDWDDEDENDLPDLSITEGALNDGRNSMQDQQRAAGAGAGEPTAALRAGRAEAQHPGAQGSLPAGHQQPRPGDWWSS